MNNKKIQDRFNAVYEEIFPLIDQKGNREFNPESVTDENISILLSWPGVLAALLAKMTGNESVLEDIKKIRQFDIEQIPKNDQSLKDKTEHVKNQQRDQSQRKKEKHEKEYRKKNKAILMAEKRIILKAIFLLHWDTFHTDRENTKIFLRSIAQYFLLMCFLIRYSETREQSNYLTLEEIADIVHLNTYSDYYGISNLGVFWLFFLETVTNKEINELIKKIDGSIHLGSNAIASKNLLMHKFLSPQNQQFSFITTIDNDYAETNDESMTIGFNINPMKKTKVPFNIWIIKNIPKCEPKKNSKNYEEKAIENDFFIESLPEQHENFMENILRSIFHTAKSCSDSYEAIKEDWGKLIEDTPQIVDDYLLEFEKWFNRIHESSNMLTIFIDFKPLKRAMQTLDCDLDYDIVKTLRQKSKSKQRYGYISLETQEKLIDACNEIEDFVKNVNLNIPITKDVKSSTKTEKSKVKMQNYDLAFKDRTNIDPESLRNFFDRKKQEYTYLKEIDSEIITDCNLLDTKFNTTRQLSRKILPIIKDQIDGDKKSMKGNTILRTLKDSY
ncbi:MAG: hypothetical protein K8S18_06905 [Desulfobacula sp.]|nr:hypothetical protein [Desulfobacula sp.]